MLRFKAAYKHFIRICKHKHWVWYFGRRLGIGWQTFWHDTSKFSPTEFLESVKYYKPGRSPIDVCKEINGYSAAWLHHKGRNPHHYEYWQDNFDNGGNPIPIPAKYQLEMLCDYLAAGVAYGGKTYTCNNEYKWWLAKREKPLAMHPDSIKFLNNIFDFLNTYFGSTPITQINSASWSIIKDKSVELLKI